MSESNSAAEASWQAEDLLRLARRAVGDQLCAIYLIANAIEEGERLYYGALYLGPEAENESVGHWLDEAIQELDFRHSAPKVIVFKEPPLGAQLLAGGESPELVETNPLANYRKHVWEKPTFIFHATDEARLQAIIDNGIEPAMPSSDPYWQYPGVYLTFDREVAESYGDFLLAVDVTGLDLYADPREERSYFHTGRIPASRIRRIEWELPEAAIASAFSQEREGPTV